MVSSTRITKALNDLAKRHNFPGRLPDFLHSINDGRVYIIEKSIHANGHGPFGLRLFIGMDQSLAAVICITPFRTDEIGNTPNGEPISIDGDFEEASEGFEIFCQEHSQMNANDITQACDTTLRKLCDLAMQVCKEAMLARPRA